MKLALSLGAAMFALSLGAASTPASAMPFAPGAGIQNGDLLQQVARGCGRGWTRSRYGRCVPHVTGPTSWRPRPGTSTRQYRYGPEGCDLFRTPRGMVKRCR